MNSICRLLYDIQELFIKASYKILREYVTKKSLGACGSNVHIARDCDIKGISNIFVGDGTSIGPHAVLWTTKAKIVIEEKVIIGPNLTIITGDHRTNIIGKYMADVTEQEKEAQNDKDVVIKKDVWIGANATILKGVVIEEGGGNWSGRCRHQKYGKVWNLCRCSG